VLFIRNAKSPAAGSRNDPADGHKKWADAAANSRDDQQMHRPADTMADSRSTQILLPENAMPAQADAATDRLRRAPDVGGEETRLSRLRQRKISFEDREVASKMPKVFRRFSCDGISQVRSR
jgi:hypothetical protein